MFLKIQRSEIKFIKQIRRQPYALKNLNKNEILTFQNTAFLRTNGKNQFFDLSNIIGKKTKKKILKNKRILKKYLI